MDLVSRRIVNCWDLTVLHTILLGFINFLVPSDFYRTLSRPKSHIDIKFYTDIKAPYPFLKLSIVDCLVLAFFCMHRVFSFGEEKEQPNFKIMYYNHNR